MNPIKRRCPLCNGSGGDPFNNPCHHCRGEGFVNPGASDMFFWLCVAVFCGLGSWLVGLTIEFLKYNPK